MPGHQPCEEEDADRERHAGEEGSEYSPTLKLEDPAELSVDEEPEGSPGAALQQVNRYIAILAKLPPAANLAPLEQKAQEVSGWRTKGMSMPGS